MSKPFPYWLRLSIVTSLSVLLSFNPAFAGRLMHRAQSANHGCRVPTFSSPVSECCTPAVSASTNCGCCATDAGIPSSDCGGGCGSTSVPMEIASGADCGCGASGSGEAILSESHLDHGHSAVPDTPFVVPDVHHTPLDSSPVPSIAPQIPPKDVKPSPKKPTPVEPEAAASPFNPAPEPPAAKEPEAPTIAPESPAIPEPAPAQDPMPEPAKPAPLDDLFGTGSTPTPAPAAAAPSAPPADDLFSTPPASEPTTKPIEPVTPPLDDLFSSPLSTEPAMKPSEPVAPPAVDDLFGTPPSNAEPAPTAPANKGLDDLFGPPAQDAPKAPPPLNDLEDLFKSSSSEPKSDFPSDSTKPVSTEVESEPNFDNLFSNPTEMPKDATRRARTNRPTSLEEKKPASVNPQEKREAIGDDLDGLFKSSSLPTESDFRGAEFREWIDNTGNYAVHARLAVIYPDRIRLVKDNGKFTTVPMSRLSDTDRDYVTWVAVSLSKGPSAKFVNTEIDPGNLNQDIAR